MPGSIQDDVARHIVRKMIFESYFIVRLFGPPGTGKSMLARTIAHTSNLNFFNITPSMITNRFIGESERRVSVLFNLATKFSPSIIFFDEVDAILPNAHDETPGAQGVRSELLTCMEGIGAGRDEKKMVIVIGATNHPERLENAFLRRFTKRLHICEYIFHVSFL